MEHFRETLDQPIPITFGFVTEMSSVAALEVCEDPIPNRGAECALQQECRKGSKLRQLPTTKHFKNPSIIYLNIQTRERKNKTNFANNEKVIEQRYKVQKAFDLYQREANETTSKNLQSEKAKLYRIYSICEEELAQKNTLIETAAKRGQCSKCWNFINEVSGRRSSKKRHSQRQEQR